jgi:tetratricopeptide (TPR) repeat protein
MRSQQRPEIRKLRNFSALAGIALVVCAVFGAVWALPPERFTLVAILLGAGVGFAIAARRTSGAPSRLAAAILALLVSTTPLTLPPIDSGLGLVAATTGQPLLAMALLAIVCAALTAALAARLPGGLLPHPAAVFAALALGLGLGVARLLPSIGGPLLGLVGLGLLAYPILAAPLTAGGGTTAASPAGSDGSTRGLLLGAGVPLLLLTTGPIFAPTPGWYAQALAGLSLGLLLAAGARGAVAALINQVGVAILPLLLLGVAELMLRSPALFLRVQPMLGEGADDGYLLSTTLTVAAFALLGASCGPWGPRSALAGSIGVVAWLVLPALLGADSALRLVVGAAALVRLPYIRAEGRAGPRLAAALAAGAALLALLIPPSPAGMRLAAPYESFGDTARLGQALRSLGRRDARVDASVAGSTVSSANPAQGLLWYRGASAALGPQQRAADHLFGHLPGLVGDPPATTLVLGASSGAVLDALRRSTTGTVFVHEPLPGLRRLIRSRGDWNRQVAADPAVRFLRSSPLGQPGGRAYDAILVDLPPPWLAGAPSAYGARQLATIRAGLSARGTAIFRLPLGALSGDELATFVRTVCNTFPAVSAWLNPSGARNLLLLARPSEGAIDAGAAYRAWRKAAVREDLSAATMAGPEDVLERMVANRHGLLQMVAGRTGRSPIGTAIVAGSRLRHGRRGLALAALAEATQHEEPLLDLTTVPPERLPALQQRIARAGEVRKLYLEMLGHWAAGEAVEALGLASHLARTSTSPARDLKVIIEPWLRRGEALRSQGLVQQARSEFLMAASFSPRDVDANLGLADACRVLGELDEAERHYKLVLHEKPQHLRASLGLADLRQKQGRAGDAVALLEEVEDSHPGSYELLVNLAFGAMQLARGTDENVSKRLSRARVLFQRAAALEPGRPEGRAGLAEIYYRLGQHKRALGEIDRALLLANSCRYHSWRGHALHGLGRIEEAEREVQQALLACPELIDALVLLGNITADQGRYGRAREAWEQVLRLDPGNRAAAFNLDQLGQSGVEELK